MKTNRIVTSLAAIAFTALLTISCSKDEKRPELPQGEVPQEQTQPAISPDTMKKPAAPVDSSKNITKKSDDKTDLKGAVKTPAANANEHKGYFAVLTKLADGGEGRITGDPGTDIIVFVTGGNAYYPIGEDGGYVGKIYGKKYGASQEVTVNGKITNQNGAGCIMVTAVK